MFNRSIFLICLTSASFCFSSESIVKRALGISLPLTNKLIIQEPDTISDESFEKVKEGNYGRALEIIVEGLEKFPEDFTLQVCLAMWLGDYANQFSTDLRDKMINRSKELFAKLINETEKQPQTTIFWFKNEYYYRFARYKNQYELGLQRVACYWNTPRQSTSGVWGYYCQGVGAANYARQLLLENNKPLAIDYAQKALVAWAQYFSHINDYYNAYVHYAMALGILGYKDEMVKSLIRSAEFIKKDLNYHEFADVIEFIKHAQETGLL